VEISVSQYLTEIAAILWIGRSNLVKVEQLTANGALLAGFPFVGSPVGQDLTESGHRLVKLNQSRPRSDALDGVSFFADAANGNLTEIAVVLPFFVASSGHRLVELNQSRRRSDDLDGVSCFFEGAANGNLTENAVILSFWWLEVAIVC
jgi:hypothetical protein